MEILGFEVRIEVIVHVDESIVRGPYLVVFLLQGCDLGLELFYRLGFFFVSWGDGGRGSGWKG